MLKEMLPIWFQATALSLISCAFMVAFCWVSRQEQALSESRWFYRLEQATHPTLYLGMPLPILFLAVRFFWWVYFKQEKTLAETVFCWLALAFILPAILAVGVGTLFLPARQQLRHGGDPSASLPSGRTDRGNEIK